MGRIDLRKNDIRFSGIMALSLAYQHNHTLLCLNLDSTKFAIKKNYKTNNRKASSSSDEDDDDLPTNQGDDVGAEEELAQHQAKLLTDIDQYQKRNQEELRKRKQG